MQGARRAKEERQARRWYLRNCAPSSGAVGNRDGYSVDSDTPSVAPTSVHCDRARAVVLSLDIHTQARPTSQRGTTPGGTTTAEAQHRRRHNIGGGTTHNFLLFSMAACTSNVVTNAARHLATARTWAVVSLNAAASDAAVAGDEGAFSQAWSRDGSQRSLK